ncbi:MAG TPA: hypothetical protein DCZ95_06220 [Verrucomicrobia bacterium]|nr:MAG: hypothetical protein A2X46_08365 [Lentisphaerae bacterium GWF2_57_35]HBA83674.1 hypothetical protein [Verrucomicrobiota bacterium]
MVLIPPSTRASVIVTPISKVRVVMDRLLLLCIKKLSPNYNRLHVGVSHFSIDITRRFMGGKEVQGPKSKKSKVQEVQGRGDEAG